MCISVGHIWRDLSSGMLYVTVKSYKATKGDEISVAIGAVVEVLQKSDSGWWLIRYDSNAATGAKNALWRGQAVLLICTISICRLSGSFSFQMFIVLVLD